MPHTTAIVETTAAVLDRLNAYTGPDVWHDIIRHLELAMDPMTVPGDSDADNDGGDNPDVFVLSSYTIIRRDPGTGRWYDAGRNGSARRAAEDKPRLARRVKAREWDAARPHKAVDAARLYDVADAEPPAGMVLVGWTWEYPDGTFGVVQPRESIGHRSQPVWMRPLFAPAR